MRVMRVMGDGWCVQSQQVRCVVLVAVASVLFCHCVRLVARAAQQRLGDGQWLVIRLEPEADPHLVAAAWRTQAESRTRPVLLAGMEGFPRPHFPGARLSGTAAATHSDKAGFTDHDSHTVWIGADPGCGRLG